MHISECYRLLGVPRNATLDDIKVAYRRLFEMPLAAWHRRSGNVDGQPLPPLERSL